MWDTKFEWTELALVLYKEEVNSEVTFKIKINIAILGPINKETKWGTFLDSDSNFWFLQYSSNNKNKYYGSYSY